MTKLCEIEGEYIPKYDEHRTIYTITRKYDVYIRYFLQNGTLVPYSYDEEEDIYTEVIDEEQEAKEYRERIAEERSYWSDRI